MAQQIANPGSQDLSKLPLTMEQFNRNIQNSILAYVKCPCGASSFLPTPICPKCKQGRKGVVSWVPVDWVGTIRTFCVTYVGPPDLADITPYVSLIADFGNGLQISALLDQKFDPHKPPLDLINKKVVTSVISRPNGGKILGMKIA